MDFVQVYLQAPIEYFLYVELSKGFKTKEGCVQTYVLQLLKNLNGQKKDGNVLNHHLNDELCEIEFKQSAVDKCVWYQDKTIFFYYVYDGIFIGPDSGSIGMSIDEADRSGLYMEYKVSIEYFLGVDI